MALDLAVAADEELLEVPLDPLQAHDARLLVLEPLPQRARLVAVDFRLAKDLFDRRAKKSRPGGSVLAQVETE